LNFVALILGLAIERLMTQLFHLRRFRWLDPAFDAAFGRLEGRSLTGILTGLAVVVAALTLPVALISAALANTLLQVPYFFFSLAVLLFSLGPRDLKEEVDDYCLAASAGNAGDIHNRAMELLETRPPAGEAERTRMVTRSVLIQANNRIFGVAFWFVLFGPTGAWCFRVMDLLRRRWAYRVVRGLAGDTDEQLAAGIRRLHGILAFIPARLVASGYALAGSFDGASSSWRDYRRDPNVQPVDINADILATVGSGALAGMETPADGDVAAVPVRAAWRLVFRTLWLIWCPILAVLTLYNWIV